MGTDYTESCSSGVEKLAVVHHDTHICITFTFHLHAQVVVEQYVRHDPGLNSGLLWNHFNITGGAYDLSVSIKRGRYHMTFLSLTLQSGSKGVG